MSVRSVGRRKCIRRMESVSCYVCVCGGGKEPGPPPPPPFCRQVVCFGLDPGSAFLSILSRTPLFITVPRLQVYAFARIFTDLIWVYGITINFTGFPA